MGASTCVILKVMFANITQIACGVMDKTLAYGGKHCWFESQQGRL